MTRRPPAPRGGAAAAVVALILLSGACAGHHPPSDDASSPPNGVRLLYQADAVTPEGKTRLKIAAAVRPPDHLRLEFFGPVGGARLVLTSDGTQAQAILPHERRYDRVPASKRAMARWTGLSVDAAGLVDLLEGRAPCREGDDPGASASVGESGAPARCPPGDAVYSIDAREGAWAKQITISMPSLRKSIRLVRIEGPSAARLTDDLFAPDPPQGFDHAELFGSGLPLGMADAPSGQGGEEPH